MAEIIDDYDFDSPKGGRPPLHPWDEWTDGKIRRLVRGKDFRAEVSSFQVMAYREAKTRGMKAATSVENDTTVVVQFRPAQ